MSFIHNFKGVVPYERSDAIAYTRALVEESATEGGVFTQIAALAIPIDPTPEDANPIDLTVTTATLERGWFRFRFDTGAGSPTSPYTEPVFSPAPETSSLVTLEELLHYATVNQVVIRSEKEPLLQTALDAAHDHVRGIPRQIDLLPAAESDPPVTLTRRVKGRHLIRVPDAREITEVTLDGTATTAYELKTCRAPTAVWVELDEETDLTGVKWAEVTGRFGMDPVPNELRQAILALALRRYKEREIGDGTSGSSEEYGVRLLPPFPKHTFEAYRVD